MTPAAPAGAPRSPFSARAMLSPVQTFLQHTCTISGGASQGQDALKRAVVARGQAQKRQCLQELRARSQQRAHATRNLRRTPE